MSDTPDGGGNDRVLTFLLVVVVSIGMTVAAFHYDKRLRPLCDAVWETIVTPSDSALAAVTCLLYPPNVP